jgi:hypothetical protein
LSDKAHHHVMDKLTNAARAGAAHANLNSAKADPVAWLNDPELEVVMDAENIDTTDPEQWDAYCAAFYLARLSSSQVAAVTAQVSIGQIRRAFAGRS